jgi:hypothetical protein
MKVLLLVIHQVDSQYDKMYEVQSAHYARYPFLDTYFVCFSENLEAPFSIEKDIIFIKGTESQVPGLLQKTIEAMLLARAEDYDFVVRSNSSTLINFNQLSRFLEYAQSARLDILAGSRQKLSWLDPAGGIRDAKYHGTTFAAGTMIVLSRHAVKMLLRYRHFLDYSVVDDVAIGVFFDRVVKIRIAEIERKFFIRNTKNIPFEQKKDLLSAVQKEINPVAWRNKSEDRQEDAKCMHWIAQLIHTPP